MAQQLQTISLEAAGFAGINTQDSPTTMDTSFAAVANNCIIDKSGRIGSRKGSLALTALGAGDSTALYLAAGTVDSIFEFVNSEGISTTFSCGGAGSPNNHIWIGDTELNSVKPSGYNITSNNWKMASLADKAYFFQRGHEPLVWNGSGDLEVLKDSQHSNGTPPQANEVIAAYGKLWATDVVNNKHTLYWSDTLLGGHWNGGASGSLDLRTVFPSGFDETVALAAHNGFLIIFCKQSILIYSGAESPATMVLQDVIENIGCIERDSVQNTGSDIIFLSDDGLRTLGRTIQEKSSPIGNLSKNVRNDLMASVSRHESPIKSVYSPEEAFYLLSLPDEDITYCFDLRVLLPDNSARVTTWSQIDPRCFVRKRNGDLYFGKNKGIFKYVGYVDDFGTLADQKANNYTMAYESHPMHFGKPSNLKFLKKLETSVIGNVGENSTLKWYYDYNPNNPNTFTIAPPSAEPTSVEYSNATQFIKNGSFTSNIDEWTVITGTASWSSGTIALNASTTATQQLNNLVSGKTYKIYFDVLNASGGGDTGQVMVATDGTTNVLYNSGEVTNGSYSATFTYDGNVQYVFLDSDSGGSVNFDNVAVFEADSITSSNTGYTGAEFSNTNTPANVSDTSYTGSEYTSGVYIQTPHASGSGNGRTVTIGLDAIISGSVYSIQRIDIQVLLGRTI